MKNVFILPIAYQVKYNVATKKSSNLNVFIFRHSCTASSFILTKDDGTTKGLFGYFLSRVIKFTTCQEGEHFLMRNLHTELRLHLVQVRIPISCQMLRIKP